MSLRPALLLLAVLALAGCAHHRPAPATDIAWSAEEMAQATGFTLQGKVGFRRGDSGGSAALTWQQDGDRYRMAANGPLGQGAVRISGNDTLVRIEDSKGLHESNEPEALLAEAIGWPVSINSLAYWVRGLPAPGTDASIEHDAEGRPSKIVQQDWEITLDRWRGDDGRVMPHRIIATGGDSRVTLLVERWTLALRKPAR